jgi:GNAT superfamily N-acetyltransferase
MTVANWRDLVKIHPAADIFPMMSDAELDALATDIDEDILRVPLSLWRAREGADWQLLDGRNRVAAMARLVDGVARIEGAIGFANTYEAHVDPWAFAISANILRRHLDAEQKRKVIADLVLADAIERCRREVARGRWRVILLAATGSGKTVIAAKIVAGAVEKGTCIRALAPSPKCVPAISASAIATRPLKRRERNGWLGTDGQSLRIETGR